MTMITGLYETRCGGQARVERVAKRVWDNAQSRGSVTLLEGTDARGNLLMWDTDGGRVPTTGRDDPMDLIRRVGD